jgi:hypothetical protein
MKFKLILPVLMLLILPVVSAQNSKTPCVVNLKDGKSIDAIHFGQLKCGKEIYSENFIIVRGKFMDSPTEIKEYRDIEKIVLEGYNEPAAASVGNEKGTLHILKKNGVSVTLTDAELAMSCYAPGDQYNTIVVQVLNPLTDQPSEQTFDVKDIQSILFK